MGNISHLWRKSLRHVMRITLTSTVRLGLPIGLGVNFDYVEKPFTTEGTEDITQQLRIA